MATSLQIIKARHVLQNYSNGQIQAYAVIATPTKHGRKWDSPITISPKVAQGTKIPASTIQKFKDQTITPRETSIQKLAKFYDRVKYFELRAAGLNKETARKYSTKTPDVIKETKRKFKKYAEQMQKNHLSQDRDVAIHYIQWGMAHSGYHYNEWEELAKISGLQKDRKMPPKFKKGRRK